MKKRNILLLSLSILLVSAISSCGNGNVDIESPITIDTSITSISNAISKLSTSHSFKAGVRVNSEEYEIVFNEDYYIPAVMQFDIKYENVDASILFLDMLIHIIEYQFHTKPYYDYYDILNALIAAKESLEKDYTLNRRFVLYRVLYTISQMMKGNQ